MGGCLIQGHTAGTGRKATQGRGGAGAWTWPAPSGPCRAASTPLLSDSMPRPQPLPRVSPGPRGQGPETAPRFAKLMIQRSMSREL